MKNFHQIKYEATSRHESASHRLADAVETV